MKGPGLRLRSWSTRCSPVSRGEVFEGVPQRRSRSRRLCHDTLPSPFLTPLSSPFLTPLSLPDSTLQGDRGQSEALHPTGRVPLLSAQARVSRPQSTLHPATELPQRPPPRLDLRSGGNELVAHDDQARGLTLMCLRVSREKEEEWLGRVFRQVPAESAKELVALVSVQACPFRRRRVRRLQQRGGENYVCTQPCSHLLSRRTGLLPFARRRGCRSAVLASHLRKSPCTIP